MTYLELSCELKLFLPHAHIQKQEASTRTSATKISQIHIHDTLKTCHGYIKYTRMQTALKHKLSFVKVSLWASCIIYSYSTKRANVVHAHQTLCMNKNKCAAPPSWDNAWTTSRVCVLTEISALDGAVAEGDAEVVACLPQLGDGNTVRAADYPRPVVILPFSPARAQRERGREGERWINRQGGGRSCARTSRERKTGRHY